MTVAVALERVSFAYPDGTPALRDVSVAIAPGERVAIVGQNGSGKSTLARHLDGLLRPGAGRVLIEGRDARDLRVAELARIVGLVFQDPDRQVFAGSVRSEVEFGPRNLGASGAELERATAEALEAVGLDGDEDTNPYDLGFGRRKLLALASVLAMRTPIVVLDEPTTAQDARGVALVQRIVERLAAEGRTVVGISHDMRFVAETFQRVVVMRHGTVVRDGPTDEVFAAGNWATLRSTYLEPPYPARVGQRLGLGSTPTDDALIAALIERSARRIGESAG